MPLQDTAGVDAIAREPIGKLILELVVPVVRRRTDIVSPFARVLSLWHVGLRQNMLIEATFRELVSLIGGRRPVNFADAETEVSLVVGREDDVQVDDISFRVDGLTRASTVILASCLVIAWLGLQSTQTNKGVISGCHQVIGCPKIFRLE